MAVVDVAHLCEHAVNVQAFHKHPGKCAHVEEVQQDCNHCTHKLQREIERERRREHQTGHIKGIWGVVSKAIGGGLFHSAEAV